MATTQLPAGTWQLDTGATTVNVSVKKLGLFTIPATLAVASGTIEIDANHEVAGVDITVDASSYSSKNAKRNKSVLGSDFLDADNHATISFRTKTRLVRRHHLYLGWGRHDQGSVLVGRRGNR